MASPPPCAVIFCAAYEDVVAFYRDALGLPLVSVEESHTILDAGGMWLIVHPISGDWAAASPPRRREAGAIKPMLNVASIAQVRERAAKFGGVVDPPEAEWPWREVICCKGHDPEGNVFEIMQPAG